MLAKRSPRDSLAHFAEDLQSQGRYSFAKQEVIKALKISDNAFNKAANRLARQSKLMRVKNNFYVLIPPEYRSSKGLPPTFYIDAFMKFYKQPYYIGVLSAAALHGAAHQAPQELQVITSKPISTIQAGRSRIRFMTKKWIEKTPTQTMKTPTGYIQVATPEATAFDLLRYSRVAGQLNNVATVLVELAEKIDPEKLVQVAKLEGELSYAQRLGFLLDHLNKGKPNQSLNTWVISKNPSFAFLRPDKRSEVIEQNKKWRVFVNTEVEPDL